MKTVENREQREKHWQNTGRKGEVGTLESRGEVPESTALSHFDHSASIPQKSRGTRKSSLTRAGHCSAAAAEQRNGRSAQKRGGGVASGEDEGRETQWDRRELATHEREQQQMAVPISDS